MTHRRIVVTGGAGFIGHHLVRKLLEMGCHVLAIDNFVRGNTRYLPEHERLSVQKIDVRDGKVRGVVADFAPDTIYHLAANHFIPDCIKDPVGTVGVNLLGTQNLLTIAEDQSVSRFVFASTADVYAASDEKHTEDSPFGSSNIYGVSKVCGESLVRLAGHRIETTQFQVVRLFNVYGPEETNPHVIPDIIVGLKSGGRLALGDLEPLRDYVYVTDVVDALIRAGQYRGKVATFNIGTGSPASVRDIVASIERILGRHIEVVTDPAKLRKIDRFRLVGDVSRAYKELEWKPAYSLEEGLRQLLAAEGII